MSCVSQSHRQIALNRHKTSGDDPPMVVDTLQPEMDFRQSDHGDMQLLEIGCITSAMTLVLGRGKERGSALGAVDGREGPAPFFGPSVTRSPQDDHDGWVMQIAV